MTQEYWQREINGKIERKPKKIIVVTWIDEDGKKWQTINPSEEQLINAGWTKYVVQELSEEQKLTLAKSKKKNEIKKYDKSKEVNEFYVSGIPLWLLKEDRTGLMLRFNAEKAKGKTTTTLWGNGIQFPLPLVDENGEEGVAFQMLYELEIYASSCYDNTQQHLKNVDNLTSVEDVESYDFTAGYPEKLKF